MSSTLTKPPSPTSSAVMAPPPPPKRIKRPPKVLDEDEYTEALSQIIARDYFPGLLESKAQDEYLTALESKDGSWIAHAEDRLRQATTPARTPNDRRSRATRNSRFHTPLKANTPTSKDRPSAGATPRGFTGHETPGGTTSGSLPENQEPDINTPTLSLSVFQSKYTSEDNESFNALLDKQNAKRREKHSYLWAADQRIPSARQIAHRNREAKLKKQRAADEEAGNSLIPITIGAGGARPARPDSWNIKRPDNSLMFPPNSVDEEDGLETVVEAKQNASRVGPKGVVYANTRLPPPSPPPPPTSKRPTSPTLSAIHDAIAGRPRLSASEIDMSTNGGGGETPRVNGYAFVDEDEPDNTYPQLEEEYQQPTYRDLLAGQVSDRDATTNPFRVGEMRRREDLHHRLVEKQSSQKRRRTTTIGGGGGGGGGGLSSNPTPRFPSSPMPIGYRGKGTLGAAVGGGSGGGLTPAAKRLLDRVAGTPTPGTNNQGGGSGGSGGGGGGAPATGLRNMWTPMTKRSKV